MSENIITPSRIIQGLMRLDNVSVDELYDLITFDLDHGINFFDLSDIYGNGSCETKFGEVLARHPELRKRMIVQSKYGIVIDPSGNYYDLSGKHLIESVTNALQRCHLDYFDFYLLHRPDIFLDVDDLKEAIKYLSDKGLVKHFGVSNFSSSTLNYLLDAGVDIKVNQMQLGLGHLDMIREVLNCNVNNQEGTMHAADLFFTMKSKHIDLQCWSPYQYGFFQGSIFKHPDMAKTNDLLAELAEKYHASKCAVATAFLLKLHERVFVITGAVNKNQVSETIDGLNVNLSKQDWYRLYCSTGNMLP